MFAASFFGALNLVVAHAARGVNSPVSLVFWRWTIAFGVLAPFVMKYLTREFPVILDPGTGWAPPST
tara:strand:+ start:3010 stop:3210 length:201 start_codon:yes stop_codon:yes gene_type:complete